MIIKNGCVTLRAIEEKDTNILLEMINSPEIEKNIVGKQHVVSLSNQKKWMESQKNDDTTMRFMIEIENGKTIGMISFTDIDWKDRHAMLNYKTLSSVEGRKKDDMYQAASGLVDYAFNELNLNRIEASILDYNIPSLKLALKLGFVKEGVQRQKIFKSGAHHDLIILGLLASEWKGY